ncbi:MAG: TonB-dependent receptor [Agriterribacter sp.]
MPITLLLLKHHHCRRCIGPYGANADLKPEKSATLEGGIQAAILAGVIDARATYFKRNIENVIISLPPAYVMTNLDKQKDHGFEIEPTIYLNKKITLKLFYTYVDGKVTTQSKSDINKDTTYSNLIRRPKHTIGANIGYQVTPQFFISTQFNSYSKREDLYFDMTTYETKSTTLKAYALWNAYAEYAFAKRKVKFFADVKNITNTKYMEVYGYSTLGFNFTGGLSIAL